MDILEIVKGFLFVFVLLSFGWLVFEYLVTGIRCHRKMLKYLEYLNKSQKFDIDERKNTSLGRKK